MRYNAARCAHWQGSLLARRGDPRQNTTPVYIKRVNLLEFSILCNNWTTPQASVDRVADAIGVALSEVRLR